LGLKSILFLNKIMKIKRCILGIPARLDSSRLPNKILADINGKPMLKRVLNRCNMVNNSYGIVVCTENKEVKEFVESWGYSCFLTSKNCKSGSERLASKTDELLKTCWGDDYNYWDKEKKKKALNQTGIINIQGDQPFIDPLVICKLIENFTAYDVPPDVITPIYKLKPESVHDPSVVKTLIAEDGRAIYFSRSAVPHIRGIPHKEWYKFYNYWGHVGIYGYRASVLSKWFNIPHSNLESLEKLEQLKLIEAGYNFLTFKIDGTSLSVDTEYQLEEARKIAESENY
tara:strand:+ start:223 stop:1080 length:858 start_codon:yes stop_codon:yes gene_type:complete